MTKAVEDIYFAWLCDRVNVLYGRSTDKTYFDLFGQLHTKEFVWIVPNDDNRLEDAMDLRRLCCEQLGILDPGELTMGVPPISVFEVIIGLSDRCAFAGDGTPPDWAWRLIENLEFHKMSDPVGPRRAEQIDDILESFIWRNYEADGVGGLFPLTHPQENQTKVELWYQMNAYIEEQLER